MFISCKHVFVFLSTNQNIQPSLYTAGAEHADVLFVIPSHVKSHDLAHLYLLHVPVAPCQNLPRLLPRSYFPAGYEAMKLSGTPVNTRHVFVQTLDFVELAGFIEEHMHDHIAVIEQDP